MTKIITVLVNENKDIVKVPAGSKALCVASSNDDILVAFEADENAPLKAVEFKYPNIDEAIDLTGFTYIGSALFDDNSVVVPVYCKEM